MRMLLHFAFVAGAAASKAAAAAPRLHWPINEAFPGLVRVVADPPVWLVRDLLTPAECDALVAKATPERLTWGGDATGLAERRTSRECRLGFDEVAGLQARFADLLALPAAHLEPLKLTRYGVGDAFAFHHDAARDGYPDGCVDCATPHCNRVATVVVYLTECGGGETVFSELDPTLPVPPRRGSAVVHFPAFGPDAPPDLRGRHDPRVGHAGAPVAAGEKVIVQQWAWTGPLLRDRLGDGYAPDGYPWTGAPL